MSDMKIRVGQADAPMSTSAPALMVTMEQSTSKATPSTSLLLCRSVRPRTVPGQENAHGEGIGEHLVAGDNILVEKHVEVLGIEIKRRERRRRRRGAEARDEESSKARLFEVDNYLWALSARAIDLDITRHARHRSKNLALAFSGALISLGVCCSLSATTSSG